MTSSRVPLGLAELILRKPCIMSFFTAQNTCPTRHVAKLRLKRRSFRECRCSRSDDLFYPFRFYPTISYLSSTCDSSGCFLTTKPLLKIHDSSDSGLEDSPLSTFTSFTQTLFATLFCLSVLGLEPVETNLYPRYPSQSHHPESHA